ncbi:MAG: selenocysteine-specific translation elongation factor [Burkholderiaceae bacterium]
MLIATAGHIDHGKTSLVRALTGKDTDRLPQEKARGLSIDLGFAFDASNQQSVIGYVDVPGHEKFVRNMLAGTLAIKAALLVIAADDGPMPQTLEHLAILDLLGVNRAVVALTKTDRVDADRLAQAKQEVAALIRPTSLHHAPVIPVSTLTNEGVPALQQAIRTLQQDTTDTLLKGRFRLAVDREFTLAGIGSVVTGTVVSGSVQTGDELNLSPGEHTFRVRSLHINDQAATNDEAALPGDRCALNLVAQDNSNRKAQRGDWLSAGAPPEVTTRVDTVVNVLASESRPLKHWTPVHVHHGTKALTGRVAPLEGKEIASGQSGLAQLVLDQATLVAHGDRFIIRDQSAQRTIGGGEVLDGFGPSKGRSRAERLECLRARQTDSPGEAFAQLIELERMGVDTARFKQDWNLTDAYFEQETQGLNPVLLVIQGTQQAISRQRWGALEARLMQSISQWHQDQPEAYGPSANELRQAGKPESARPIVDACLDHLVRSARVARIGTSLKLPEHQPVIPPDDLEKWSAISPHLHSDEIKPPVVSALAELLSEDQTNLEDFLRRCTLRGQLIQVAPNRFFHPQAVARLGHIAYQTTQANGGQLHVKALRDQSGIGRNLSIEVLEFFDALGFTRRIGDVRHIIKPVEQVFSSETERNTAD